MTDHERLQKIALTVRKVALSIVYRGRASHLGSGYSCVELLTYLYGSWLRVKPETRSDSNRDRFILSKGHAAAVYYVVLSEFGFIPKKDLETFYQYGSVLGGHVHHLVPGVEVSTGSLGHGLPMGVGMALAAKRSGKKYRIAVLVSDGEMEAGSNWEALNMAAAQGLDNLTVIIDRNGLQAMGFTKDILPMENLKERIAAFGCGTTVIDGHDFADIATAFNKIPLTPGAPSVIIADTVKGKGVRFMENRLEWHYKSPSDEQYAEAMRELEAS